MVSIIGALGFNKQRAQDGHEKVDGAIKKELKSITGKKIKDDSLEKNLRFLVNTDDRPPSKLSEKNYEKKRATKVSDLKGSWRKKELLSYLDNSTPYQKLLLSALVQQNEKPVKSKVLQELMIDVATRCPALGITKTITELDIAGARAGLGMRRKPFGNEDIIICHWSKEDKSKIYELKDKYRQVVCDWLNTLNI